MDNVAARDAAAAGSSQREGLQGSAWIFSLQASPVVPQLCQSSAGMLPGSPVPGLAPWGQSCPLGMSWSAPISLFFPVSALTCPQTEILWSREVTFWLMVPG